MNNNNNCENCTHYIRDKILTEIIQDLVRFNFLTKIAREKELKEKNPIWDNLPEDKDCWHPLRDKEK